MIKSQWSKWFTPRPKPIRRANLQLEELESRWVPSATVTTWHNDGFSSGQNLTETALTPATVNSASFGKLFSTPVDGDVYAQPLYVPSLSVQGQTHNVAFVATEHNSVYAIDADNGTVLWQKSFMPAGERTLNPGDVVSGDLSEVGITSTPMIDSATNTMYFLTKSTTAASGTAATAANTYQRLHAVDLTTGDEKFGNPVLIQATVNGTGAGNDGNGHISFNALIENQRSALVLSKGVVYIAWASHGDNGPYHGWIMGYRASDLTQVAVFNTTPNGEEAGIWMGGAGPTVDAQGNLYVETGNGSFNNNTAPGTLPTDGDYGDAFLKLTPDSSTASNPNVNGWGLKVTDFFVPSNQQALSQTDEDLGSGTPMLLPDSAGSAAHPHLLIGAGKEGKIYLIDRDNMGKFDPNGDHVVQEVQQNKGVYDGLFGSTAYYKGAFYYVGSVAGPASENPQRWTVANGAISSSPVSTSSDTYGFPGSTPSISANGDSNGIVWDLNRSGNTLNAYDASDYSKKLYSSSDAPNGRDSFGNVVKFTVPTVVNGHVYVGASKAFVGFGLLTKPPVPAAASAQAGNGQVTVTWTPSAGAASYNLYRSTASGAEVKVQSGITGTSFTDTGLSNGTTYFYKVSAVNSAGESGLSTETSATPQNVAPAAPANVTAAPGDSKITVSWVASSGATSYNLFRATASGAEVKVQTGLTGTSFTDTGLTNGTTYYYQVTAVNGSGESGRSAEASTTAGLTAPAAPSNLQATATSGTTVSLTWQANSTNQTGFKIDRATDAAFSQNLVSQSATATATSFADSGLTAGTTYYYRIRATNSAGDSANSATASVLVPTSPAKPSNAQPTAVTTTEIDFSWQDNATNEDGYKIFRKDGTGGSFQLIATLPPDTNPAPSTDTYQDKNLTPGTEYEYHIQAFNVAGYNDFAGFNTDTLTVAPTGLTAVAGSGQVTLNWTAPTGADTFNVYRGTTPGGEGATAVATGLTAATFTDSGLTNGTTYYYQVTAVDVGGESARSGETSATPAASGTGVNFANGFAGATGLTLNGSAHLNGSLLELTNTVGQAGSAFATTPVSIVKFTSNFSFQLTNANADGFAFVIEGAGPTALGPAGGGLGYGPDHAGGTGGIGQSAAIKFDLYSNQGEGNDSTGLYLNGAAPTSAGSVDLTNSGIDLHSGHVFNAALSYDGTTLSVTLTDATTGASATQKYQVNLSQVVGGNTAYVGFTGGTGGLGATQDILTWTFTPSTGTTSTQVNLSGAFNRVGIATDGTTFTGGLDGVGYAYSANALPSPVKWNGTSFTLGAANANDVVSAAGQVINLPAGTYSALSLLATGVNGNQANQAFVVKYTDGTSQTFNQSISDWYTPQNYTGESVAATTAYRDTASGGKDSRSFDVYSYQFSLNASKTLQSITLPNNANVELLAITLTPTAATPTTASANLAASFNRNGIVNDGSTFSGGLDGGGTALSAQQLGASVTWSGAVFTLGSAGGNNVVSASGQTISLPSGNFSTLAFLATGVNGNQANQAFVVKYTDGTSQTFNQSISDWYTPQNYTGESVAATTAYRDTASGGKDSRPFDVYGYKLALNSGKTVQSITLPNNGNVVLFAIDLIP